MNPRVLFPENYRSDEVRQITSAVRSGECVSVVGLSGSGKSNLLVYLAGQKQLEAPAFFLVDCNRLDDPSLPALFRLIHRSLGGDGGTKGSLEELDWLISTSIDRSPGGLCLLFDRFELLSGGAPSALYGNLRALRDAHKYALTYVTASRRPIDPSSELAELFYAHTLWLGPLTEADARWSVNSYAQRAGVKWDEASIEAIIKITYGYPSLLRAVSEAFTCGCRLEVEALARHPAVSRRIAEFWSDNPGEAELRLSGLLGQPLLMTGHRVSTLNPQDGHVELTAKENLLLSYFRAHPGAVCEKDDLIRAVWPEDRIFESGVRDDSLAQLVRRLRTKIETDPSQPRCIQTVTGRGYRYVAGKSAGDR